MDTTHIPRHSNGLHQSQTLSEVTVVERVEALQLGLNAMADIFLDALGSVNNALITLGLAFQAPDSAQGLAHIVCAPIRADDAGAWKFAIEVVQ